LTPSRSKAIPEDWYRETESKLICLHCHKTFKKEYEPKTSRRRGKAHGTKALLSLWAWYNFRKHVLRCRHLPDYTMDPSPEGRQEENL
jgi:hypothetical protein